MNVNGSESGHTHQEARRDVIGRAGIPNSGAHHDALLRYLRGLYVRPQKTQSAPQRTEAAGADASVDERSRDAAVKEARREPATAKPVTAPKPAKAAKR